MKLSEFKVSFKVRKELKDHLFVDFLSEIIIIPPETAHTWMIFTGISSNSRRSGINVILENGVDLVVYVSLRFKFSTTNNQTEYEVMIARMTLEEEIGAGNIKLWTNSQLVIS